MTFRRGFTLIELLVVISIVALLSSIVLSSLNTARAKGRDARRLQDLHQIDLALRLYFNANGTYPSLTYDASANNWTGLQPYLTPYMPAMTLDPTNNASATYYYYIKSVSPAWISANSWSKLTADCAGKTVLVAHAMESSGNYRQDCVLSDPKASVIVLD